MEDLKKLLAAATPGPWTHASDKLAAGNIKAPDNAALIVAAVNALPELIARVERLEEALSAIVEGAQLSEYEGLTDDRGFSMRLCGPNFLEDFTLGDLRHARAALKETGQ